LAAINGPAQNIFFFTVHFFDSFVPIALQDWQEAVLGRLSLNMCLWICLSRPWKANANLVKMLNQLLS
jgi:hypothetical protein